MLSDKCPTILLSLVLNFDHGETQDNFLDLVGAKFFENVPLLLVRCCIRVPKSVELDVHEKQLHKGPLALLFVGSGDESLEQLFDDNVVWSSNP